MQIGRTIRWAGILWWLGLNPMFGQTLPEAVFQSEVTDLGSLAETVQNETGIRWYFASDAARHLPVQRPAGSRDMSDILQATLQQTDWQYWIEAERQVLVWQGNPIEAQMAAPATGPSQAAPAQLPPIEEAERVAAPPSAPVGGADIREERRIGENTGAATATLAGVIRKAASGTPIAGATIAVPALQRGTYSDDQGYFALNLPTGDLQVSVRSFGMTEILQPIVLRGDGTLNLNMVPAVRELDEVVIEAQRRQNVDDVRMGVNQVGIDLIRQLPPLLGEVDVVRAALLLPGVQTVGEGAAGFNVRGGSVDQNLVLLEQAPVYNASHLFGFFSAFHPDIVQDFELYKSGIPARYGGRIASVFEVGLKEGNRRDFRLHGGLSPLTGRLAVEGPLVKEKGAFILGGRSTYSNWLLGRLPDAALRNSRANFFDLTGKLSLEPNPNNRVDLMLYGSQDQFRLNADTTFGYQNRNASLRWKHLFTPRLYGVFSAIYSQYQFAVGSNTEPAEAYQLGYAINHYESKADFSWLRLAQHQIRFGANAIWYELAPGEIRPGHPESQVLPRTLQQEQAVEGAVYLSDEWTPGPRFSVYAGLRWSAFAAYGPRKWYLYAEGMPRRLSSISDTLQAAAGEALATYQGPEFRLALRYRLDEASSLKFSYNRTRQYLHRVSNTIAIAPTDTWKLSDRYIRPQVGDQFAIGYFRNFRQNSIETSIEAYYKPIQNLIDYRGGADLLLNAHVETELLNARGRAYGVELLIRKVSGRLNGWVSYTYARSLVRVESPFPEEQVNDGAWYPANFDKPHDLTVVANFQITRRWSVSSNFTYSTGRPITFPIAQYQYAGSNRVFYSDRNAFRIPDYIRWDFSINLEGNHRRDKFAHSSVSLAVYNLLGRRNAYSIYFNAQNGQVNGYQLSIFGRPIPTLTYNFRI